MEEQTTGSEKKQSEIKLNRKKKKKEDKVRKPTMKHIKCKSIAKKKERRREEREEERKRSRLAYLLKEKQSKRASLLCFNLSYANYPCSSSSIAIERQSKSKIIRQALLFFSFFFDWMELIAIDFEQITIEKEEREEKRR